MNNKSAITLWSESVQWFPHCLPVIIRYKFLYNLPFSPRSLPVATPLPLSLSQSLTSHPYYSVDSKGPLCPLACLCQCCSFFLECPFPTSLSGKLLFMLQHPARVTSSMKPSPSPYFPPYAPQGMWMNLYYYKHIHESNEFKHLYQRLD